MTLLVRSGAGMGIVPAIRARISSLDSKLPLSNVRMMTEVVSSNLALHRFISLIVGAFASIALLLMVAGLYGVISYATAQRAHEIGVRMALGATRVDIGGLVVRSGLSFCVVGAAIGAAGGYALARSAATLLFEIQPSDPSTYAVLVTGVLGIAAAASWIPARRAMRVDPTDVLRNQSPIRRCTVFR